MSRIILLLIIAVAIGLMAPAVQSDSPSPIYLPIVTGGGTSEADPLALGKCMTLPSPQYGADMEALGVDCFYTWHYKLTQDVPGQFIPMIWGPGQARYLLEHPDELQHNGIVLLFNECDAAQGQCQATPEEAADLTRQLQAAFPEVKHWGTPAVHCDRDVFWWACSNKLWLDQYMAACSGCRFSFLALHFYAWGGQYESISPCSEEALVGWVNKFRKYGLPIWLTEFGCLDGRLENRLQAYQRWYDIAQADPQILAVFPWVSRVDPAQFGPWATNFVDYETGELTELGLWYAQE